MPAQRAVRARHDQRGGRPARAPARRRAGVGREDRPQLARGDGRDEARACGARSSSASPTPAGPEPTSSCRCGATPIRRRARARSPRSASRNGSRSNRTVRHRDRRRDRHRDHRLHRAARRARRASSTVGTSATTCTPRPPPARGRSPGARWVATRECKAVRPPGATWFGDPARARSSRPSGCSTGTQPEWDAWVARQMEALRAEGDRMFAGRDHLHTAVYRFAGEARAGAGISAATALDHPFRGLVAVAVEAGRGAECSRRDRAAATCRPSPCSLPSG